ncbi:MAG: transketolase C-terminal domain-containing protein [Actinomycetota bacterium]|nr:transketolase C-terminal domain-containing protein [Actinomycetota bacterium]
MTKPRATREGYADALLELGEELPNVVVLDSDLSKSTGAARFGKAFPDRFINCGVAEQSMMGAAAGLAACGKICYTGSFAVFATGRAFEQIRNSIAYCNFEVKICPSHAGVTVGQDGGSHQSVEDIALMRCLPNMKVIVPADYIEAKTAVKAAAHISGPIYIRLGRPAVTPVNGDDYAFEFGRARVLRVGGDVTILAIGIMVGEALKAADRLAEEGISAEVINVITVKPLDEETILASVRKTGRAITAEEHSIIGGLGGAISELLGEKHPAPVKRIGIGDMFGLSGSADELLRHFKLTAGDIAEAARELLLYTQ